MPKKWTPAHFEATASPCPFSLAFPAGWTAVASIYLGRQLGVFATAREAFEWISDRPINSCFRVVVYWTSDRGQPVRVMARYVARSCADGTVDYWKVNRFHSISDETKP